MSFLVTCRVVFWLLALGFLYYCYKNAQKTDDYLVFLPLGNQQNPWSQIHTARHETCRVDFFHLRDVFSGPDNLVQKI